MSWQGMTNNIDRKRNPPRGILTQKQKEKLQKGNIDRQTISNIRLQTTEAIMIDLPLIIKKIGVERLYSEPFKWKKILEEFRTILEKYAVQ